MATKKKQVKKKENRPTVRQNKNEIAEIKMRLILIEEALRCLVWDALKNQHMMMVRDLEDLANEENEWRV